MVNNTINESEFKSPLLFSLRDEINFSSTEPEKELAIRKWKNELLQKNYREVLDVVNEINTSASPYIRKTLVPMLQESLQQTNINSILTIIQDAYASKLGKDSFTDKKSAIKDKLHDLYDKKILDNRLIFGLWMTLNKNPDIQYKAGTFRADIKKWMYTGDTIHESFWNKVTGTELQQVSVKENITEEVLWTLASKQ